VINTLNDLYPIESYDIKKAVRAGAKAYFEAEDKPFEIPDPTKRRRYIEILMKITLRQTLKYGWIYAPTPNIEGFAAWLPHHKTEIPIWRYIQYGALHAMLLAGLKSLKIMTKYDSFCKKQHKKHANFPHIYLYNLAIDPKYQGKGYASKLLNPMLNSLDEQNLPCYLETGENNVPLYQHFGFEVVEKALLVDFRPEMFFMLRNSH
jgi:ribosomal protein S18 acetylase RimI-like enzyme